MASKRLIAVGFALLVTAACGSDGAQGMSGAPSTQGPTVAPPAMGSAGAAAPMTTAPVPSTNTPTTAPPTTTTPGPTPTQPGPMTTPPATTPNGSTVSKEAAADPLTPYAMLPAECRGLELAGMKFSPGGTTLPNKCAPFNNVHNNPFSIRCIDADPSFHTNYPGDDFCILPPDPKNGTQVHMGPASYDNPDPSFIMQPGQEITDWYYTKAPNSEEHMFYRVNIRMRAGSHHMINRLLDDPQDDGFQPIGDLSFGNGPGSRSFQGAQRPDVDIPQGTMDIPPENQGLGAKLLKNQQFSLNLHHFNFSDHPVLREVWINVWYIDPSQVKATIESIAAFGNPLDVTIAPGEKANLEYACDITEASRIITLNGHRHAHTTRFGVWMVRGGQKIPLYDSFHYDDMPTFQYDSISKNPTADATTAVDGAFTGILNVMPGDSLHFECDINNDSANTLRFANEVETGEMCILFGSRVGPSICDLPARVE